MKSPSIYAVFRKILGFRLETVWWHIRIDLVSGFYYEPPDDDELPLGGATLFCTIFVVLWCRSHRAFWNWLVYTMFDFTNINWIIGFGDKDLYQRFGITMELVIEVEQS